jgi:hypothetical protein
MSLELQKTTPTSSAALLRLERNNFYVALRGQQSVTVARLVAKLGERAIDRDLAQHKEDVAELERLRREYRAFAADAALEPAQRAIFLQEITAQGAVVKARVDGYCGPVPVRTLPVTEAEECIMILLLEADAAVNVANKLTEEQIKTLAVELVQELGSLTLEDFAVALKRGRDGRYSKDIYRLDGAVVRAWLKGYLQERAERVMAENHSLHASTRGDRSFDGTAAERRAKEEKKKQADVQRELYAAKDYARFLEGEIGREGEEVRR